MNTDQRLRLGFKLDPSGVTGELDRVEIKSAAEQVVERLVTAIALGSYLPGQKFPPERELSSRLGVSRATLRTALHRLAEDGYVTIRRGRDGGARVTAAWSPRSPELIRRTLEPTWKQIEALFDFGRELELLIARLAAERRRKRDLVAMRKAARRYAEATDREAMGLADKALDTAIARATQNPHYVSLISQLRARLTLGTEIYPYTAAIREQALREHELLVSAIDRRDAAGAVDAAYRHFVDLVEVPLRDLYMRVHRRRTT